MGNLDQHVTIACPLAQAAMRLTHFFKANGNGKDDVAKLALHAGVEVPGRAEPIELQRSVIATIELHPELGDMEPRYRLAWAPAVPGPFPSFAGELIVGGTEDYDSFSLRLIGDYTPPLGLVGQGFDAVVGKHIASATADDLLHRIRDAIEREFRADEANKHGAARNAPHPI